MATFILHDGTMVTATGGGTDGGFPAIMDVTGRRLTAFVHWETVTPPASGTASGRIQVSEFSGGPWFTTDFVGTADISPPGEIFRKLVEDKARHSTQIADGDVSFIRVENLFGAAGPFGVKVSVLDGPDVVVQTAPVTTVGANAYLPLPDLLDLMSTWSCAPAIFFPTLTVNRQEAVWIGATRRLETEVRSLCPPQPSGSSPVSPGDQELIWPRLNAWSAAGPLIESWLPSWVEAAAHLAEEMGQLELLGEELEEPGEDEGLTEIVLEAEGGVRFSQRFAPGTTFGFFKSRQKILSLIVQSFPTGGLA